MKSMIMTNLKNICLSFLLARISYIVWGVYLIFLFNRPNMTYADRTHLYFLPLLYASSIPFCQLILKQLFKKYGVPLSKNMTPRFFLFVGTVMFLVSAVFLWMYLNMFEVLDL